jgi:hypothetical protein
MAARKFKQEQKSWKPLAGPQTHALESKADIVFYGGAAGGGKTDLLLGATLQHQKSIIFRREFTQLSHIIERSKEMFTHLGKFTQSPHPAWRIKNKKIELGSCATAGDENKYQGQPHDLICFDELPHFLESQFRMICGWLRSADPKQRCRVIAAGNPPMQPEEEWVVQFFAPWLDPQHPNPAAPMELRWFAMVKGVDTEVVDNRAFVLVNGELTYDFDPKDFKPTEIIRPMSRTFIPASVEDNPYYMASGYVNQLAALPEPLRSKLLYGDFKAGKEDHAWQVIPSAWVTAAQERWKAKVAAGFIPTTPLSAIGCDVARGGKDKTILSPRWDNFFGEQELHQGTDTPDGGVVADLLMKCLLKNNGTKATKINIDVIGVGSSPYDFTKKAHGDQTNAMNASESTDARDKSGMLGFVNSRAQWWWQFREALDPSSGQDICLPPSRSLYVDLCTPRWKLSARGIQIESKDDIIKRIKRSPDEGDSCVYAHAQKYFEGWGIMEVMRQQVEQKQRLEREAKERK